MLLRNATFAAVLCLATSAAAQTSDPANDLARANLITQAEQARDANDHAHALDFAERAGRIRMTPSLRLLIAQEHHALGHVLEALEAANLCEREGGAVATFANRERVLANCHALATTLRPRVGSVTVNVAPPVAAGTHVRVQGAEIVEPLWGVAYPVMPGVIVVEATSPRGAFRREVRVDAGSGASVDVTFASSASTGFAASSPGARASDMAAPAHGPGAAPWVLMGTGVAVVLAGTGFYGAFAGARSSRDAACDASGCDAVAQDYQDRSATFRVLSGVSYGLGGAAAGAGLLWFLLAPRRADATWVAWSAADSPLPGGAMLSAGGSL